MDLAGKAKSTNNPSRTSQNVTRGSVARIVWEAIMAGYVGLVAVVAIVIFIVGILAGICIIMAAGIRAADRTSMRRRDRALVLRDEPTNPAERGIRRLAGVGQRVGPEHDHR
jgi:hypothetical protein